LIHFYKRFITEMTRTPEVTESWVDWSGQQSLVLTLDKTSIKDPLEPPLNQNVIVIIPGNPGLGTMYTDFMKTLSDNLDCDTLLIHAFSYLGHETHQPSYLPTAPTYTLEDQIEHKIALLEKLIPRNAQLTLIGHSIGCKICMEIFRRNSTHAIKDVFFLFPTIENMVTTVRGQQTLPWVTTFRLLALVLITVISFLPDFLLKTILKLRYRKASPTFLSSVLNFVNSNHLNNCLMLAKNELETVLDLDVDTIKQMV